MDMKNVNDIERLNQKVKRLRTLIEVNEVISSSLEIDTILENVMLEIMYEVPFLDGIKSCRITEAVVKGGGEPVLQFEAKKTA